MGKVKLSKKEKKKLKLLARKEKKQNNVLGRVFVDLTGVKVEHKGYFAFVDDSARLIEKIVQCARVGLTENQIISALKIKKEIFTDEVQEFFTNTNHMFLLVSLLPINISEFSDMQDYWLDIRNEIEGLINQGLGVQDIAAKYCVSIESIYKYISNEFGGIENTELIETKTKSKLKGITMSDYSELFGFNGLSFNYSEIDKNIKLNIPKMDFDKFISKYNYIGIKDIVYVRSQILKVYKESRPFYPAEDMILIKYYPKVGTRVIEILEEVIPNYKVRDIQEYGDRMKLLKNVKIHPKNSFGITEIDKKIIRLLCEKEIPLTNNKYIPWMNTVEIQYYAYLLGYTDKKPLREYDEIDIGNLDITPYIEMAMKLKEVKFHSEKWTMERHNFFKEGYREKGIDISEEIDWATKFECILRAKQFCIKQRYSEEETERIKEVFLKDGWEGLKKEFPNRTEKALKYKIEEMGLLTITNAVVSDNQIENLKAELIDEIREEERIKLRQEMKRELEKEVEKELTPILETRIRKNVEYTLRKELIPRFRESELNRLHKELDKFVDNILGLTLKLSITSAINRIPPKDYGTRLVDEIYNNIVENLVDEIDKLK